VIEILLFITVTLLSVVAASLLTRNHFQHKVAGLQNELVRMQERSEQEAQAAAEKLQLLQDARKQLAEEFNNLANRIFDEKSDRLLKSNKESMETTLSPLRTQLKDFRKRVDDVYDKETRDRVSLLKELELLKQLNQRMSDDAVNLTRALKGDKKTQGNWGEVILERVLEESGLRKGHEYETQFATQDEEGTRRLPDVVVRLPEGKDIVIDSKVSLVDYERYVSSEDEAERQTFLAAHVSAIRQHIAGLSIKEYEKLEALRSLDFVLLFIPIESAFMAAFDADPEMYRVAYDKQVIVVSPTTLLATLRTVQSIWRYEHQNRNSEKIARQAGAIHDQFALVLESLADVGKHIDKAGQAFDKTRERMTSGRGNLTRRVQQLEELGARTKKKLPSSMIDAEDALESDEKDEKPLLGEFSED
jgi:DNA recombination protein RmuC